MKQTELEAYVEHARPLLVGRYLSRASMYGPSLFLFRLSGGEFPRLSFSLSGEEPCFYLSRDILEGKSLESSFLDVIKKRLYRARIDSIEILNDDRIVEFGLTANEEALFPRKRYLVLEAFPRHGNLILLDEERKVITAYRVSSMEDKRPLFKGLKYQNPPQNPFKKSEIDLNLDSIIERLSLLDETHKASRKKERFGELEKYLKSRKKALEKKVKALEKDIVEAESRLDGQTKGDLIFTYYSEIDPSEGTIVLDGIEIKLDPRKNLSQNAESYYRQAKRAKEAIRLGKEHLESVKEELLDVESAILQYEASDEEGLETMARELAIPEKGRPRDGWKGLSRASLPHECRIGDTRLLYGTSAKENDCLTFLFERGRKLHWFHVMGDSGSHLILKSENPSKEEIQLAAEICLLLSKKEDGDVMHALRGDVHKGSVPGQAIVKKFETLHVRKVSNKAREILVSSKKADRP